MGLCLCALAMLRALEVTFLLHELYERYIMVQHACPGPLFIRRFRVRSLVTDDLVVYQVDDFLNR